MKPSYSQPTYSQPTYSQPTYSQPSYPQAVASSPTYGEKCSLDYVEKYAEVNWFMYVFITFTFSLSLSLTIHNIFVYPSIFISIYPHIFSIYNWVGVCANPGEQLRARQGRQRYHHPAGVRLLPGKLAVKTVTRQISCGCYPVIFGCYSE